MLAVKPPQHPLLFFCRKLRQVIVAPLGRKDFQAVEPQHTLLPIARFNQRVELPLHIEPVQEVVNQGAIDLSGATCSHPSSLSLPKRRSKHIPSTSASSLLMGLALTSRLCRGLQMTSRSINGRAMVLAQRVNGPASKVKCNGRRFFLSALTWTRSVLAWVAKRTRG